MCLVITSFELTSINSFAIPASEYTTYKPFIDSHYTASEIQVFKEEIDGKSEYKGRHESTEGTLYKSAITDKEILYYLDVFKHKPIYLDTMDRYINPHVYKKYKIEAYEDLDIIEKGQMGHGSLERVDAVDEQGESYKEVEYRYLGYTESGEPITNDFYPADFKNTTAVNTRTYKTTPNAAVTWKEFREKKIPLWSTVSTYEHQPKK
jgi:DNA repair exonuclease SbcCD nuclease subunit